MDVLHYFASHQADALAPGHTLFREGDDADVMYVLMDGIAEIFVGNVYVEFATPGALLGEMALIDGSKRSATIVCRTECRAVRIDQAQFDALIRDNPQFARYVMALMAKRLRRMNEGIKPMYSIQLEKGATGQWSYAVYARDRQGKRSLAGRFANHEIAVQNFPQARQAYAQRGNSEQIPST